MTLAEDLTAYGTLALAAVGAAQTYVTRQAVRSTREDVRESRRARIDASAPRVTFICRATSWPPHLIDHHDVTARPDVNTEHRFVLPRDNDQVIYVAAAIDLINESDATAFVTLPEDVAITGAGGSTEPGRDGDTAFFLRQGRSVVLAPHQRLNVWVRASRGAGDWAVAGGIQDQEPLCRVITVEDTLADGVRDETTIQLRAVPIIPSGPEDHAWVLNSLIHGQLDSRAVTVTAVVAPTVRTYRGEAIPQRRWWHPRWSPSTASRSPRRQPPDDELASAETVELVLGG